MTLSKKIFFLSDFHLGVPNYEASLLREKKIVAFLDSIKHEAEELFLLGDMFDFWYEYKKTVPKGFTRLLGKLAELSDSGIVIHFFVGNHDMWMKDYFKRELNIAVYFEESVFERFGKKLFIAHGDGLGPGDHGYKFLKKIFRNPLCDFLFGILPPTIGMGLANFFSGSSRKKTGDADSKFLGVENEWLIIFSKEKIQQEPFDYLIFGHRHYPLQLKIGDQSEYVNLGDWITHFTYAELNSNGTLVLKKYHL